MYKHLSGIMSNNRNTGNNSDDDKENRVVTPSYVYAFNPDNKDSEIIPMPKYHAPHLSPLSSPVDRDPNKAYAALESEDEAIETAFSPRKIDGRTNNWRRRQHALALGNAALLRPKILLDLKYANYRKAFDADWNSELELLDELTKAVKFQFTEEDQTLDLYSVQVEILKKLNELIQQKVNILKTAFKQVRHLGKFDLPVIPPWGDSEHPAEALYHKNDLEILLVTYRGEIESFIVLFYFNVCNFEAIEKLGPEVSRTPPRTQSPVHNVSPYKEDLARILSRFNLKQEKRTRFEEEDSDDYHSPTEERRSPFTSYYKAQTRDMYSQRNPSDSRSWKGGMFQDMKPNLSGPLM